MIARSEEEIQRAHDLLKAIVTGRIKLGLTPAGRAAATSYLDVLCWLLGHEQNQTFQIQVGVVEDAMKALGCELPVTPHEGESQTDG